MDNNLLNRINTIEKDLASLKDIYYRTHFIDKDIFQNPVYFNNKISFFKVTPTGQQGAVTTPTGGGSSFSDAVDISARTAIGQIKTILKNLGLTL